MSKQYLYFAQAYGEGAYSGCTYNNSTSCSSSGGGTGTGGTGTGGGSGNSGGNGQLTNTGFDILILVTLACLLIFVALVVRLWRKKNSRNVPQTPAMRTNSEKEEQDQKPQA